MIHTHLDLETILAKDIISRFVYIIIIIIIINICWGGGQVAMKIMDLFRLCVEEPNLLILEALVNKIIERWCLCCIIIFRWFDK